MVHRCCRCRHLVDSDSLFDFLERAVNVTSLVDYVRQNYNAVGDTFYSDSEIYLHIFNAQMELATKTHCVKRVYTTTTTASTQEYSAPTNALAIKRITYNGKKLVPITMREDDEMTLGNQASTATGEPSAYYLWGDSIFLREIPDSSSGTLKIFTYDKPQTVSASSTLDVPDRYHADLADYCLWRMTLKDKDSAMAGSFKESWEKKVKDAVIYEKKKLRADALLGVRDTEYFTEALVGPL
jgi:hypothetical protein